MANEFKIKKGLIVQGSGSTVLDIQGSQGQLFSVTDNLSGSLFSVNDISGLPILQVSSDDSVKLGTFNAEAIKVSGSNAIITGSLLGTSSYATTTTTALSSTSASYATVASSSLFATNASSSLQAVSASRALSASNADLLDNLEATAFVLNNQTSSMTVNSASFAINASSSLRAISASQTVSSSFANVASSSLFSTNASSSLWAVSASQAISSSFAINASSSLRAVSASQTVSSSFANVASSSLFATNASSSLWAVSSSQASTASFLNSNTNGFIQGGNSFGTTALLGTNDNQSLALETNGSTRMFISSSGNVGIGTIAPSAKFQVVGGSDAWSGIVLRDGGTNNGIIDFKVSDNSTRGSIQINGVNGAGGDRLGLFAWVTGTGLNEVMSIKGGGNVGIGTTNPGSKLTVTGTGRVLNAVSTNDQVIGSFGCSSGAVSTVGFYGVGSSNDYNVRIGANLEALVAYTADTERMRITSAGNVGIGTTNPIAKLTLAANSFMMVSTDFGGKAGILFSEAGTPTATDVQYGAKIFYDEALDLLQLSTRQDNVDKLGIAIARSSGNVGIGTTSPISKLDVAINDNAYATAFTLRNTNTGSNALSQIVLETASNLSGTFAIRQFNSAGHVEIANYANAGMNFWTNGSVKVTILANGNVGIGKTDPTEKLDVAGVIRGVLSDPTGVGGITAKLLSFAGSPYGLVFRSSPTGTHTIQNQREANDTEVYPIILQPNGSNVGIGTNPSAKLHVQGDISGSTKLTIGSEHTNTGISSSIAGGVANKSSGNCSFVGGGVGNQATGVYSTVGGGYGNQATNTSSTIGGGYNNQATNTYSTVGGGLGNISSNQSSTVAGGQSNQATQAFSTVAGGGANQATGQYVVIGGGNSNIACGYNSTIAGGQSNSSPGQYSTVGGGVVNRAIGAFSTVAGGYNNHATLDESTVGGGRSNRASGSKSTIGGGCQNLASGLFASILGGNNNIGSGVYSTVGGGVNNNSTNNYSTVGGGVGNISSNQSSTVAGGQSNQATQIFSTVAGGVGNQAKGEGSFIGSGNSNMASGSYSGILGGVSNTVTHACSFIIGTSLTSTSGSTTYMNNATIACHLQVGGTTTMNTTTGRIDASNDVVAFATSDYRLKENIQPIKNALCKLIGVSGNTFDWKPLTKEEIQTIHGNKGRDVGVIAQEIEAILPEAVTTRDNGYKAVNYEKIIPLLIEAIKDQQKQIDELKSKL